MWKRAFNPDNFLFRWIAKLTDIVILSLLWVFISLPIFTLGAATTALYDCVVKCIRGNDPHTISRFFRVFRENFKVSTICSLIWAAVGALLWWGSTVVLTIANNGNPTAAVIYVAYCIFSIIPAGIVCWMFPILSRFTFGVGGLNAASFQLAIAHLPSTVIIVLLTAEVGVLCIQYWFPVLFMPAIAALLWSLFIERAFKKHKPGEGIAPGTDGTGN